MDYKFPPVAQLDNAADSDSEDRGFESLRAGQKKALAKKASAFLMMFALRSNDVAYGNDDASLMMCPAGHKEQTSHYCER